MSDRNNIRVFMIIILLKYSNYLFILMSKPSDDQIKLAIDAVFVKYDLDKSNTLDYGELKNVIADSFKQLGASRNVTDLDVKKFVGAVDKNNDGKVTKVELFEIFKRISMAV